MKEQLISILLIVIFTVFILWFISYTVDEIDKTCIGTEMQYYNVECVGEEHKVCKTGEMKFYFNMSGEDNLTETEIDSLARGL